MAVSESKPTKIAVAVVRRGNEFLVGVRPEHVDLAGSWEFPGGKVEPNETFEQAAVRECFEETGLAIEINRLIYETMHSYQHGELELRFFLCSLSKTGKGNQSIPNAPFSWVDRNELRVEKFPAANAPLFQMV